MGRFQALALKKPTGPPEDPGRHVYAWWKYVLKAIALYLQLMALAVAVVFVGKFVPAPYKEWVAGAVALLGGGWILSRKIAHFVEYIRETWGG